MIVMCVFVMNVVILVVLVGVDICFGEMVVDMFVVVVFFVDLVWDGLLLEILCVEVLESGVVVIDFVNEIIV